ncbi:aldo/keto reductase [Nitrosomonas sp.]|uniref:aldo/keto reductase n=1 Tax=Nitrosomonas sp. TaxID=42353 RepID=UPI0025EE0C92|nr:aldo/keto reductase [Nitrosomonas sp.]
MTFNLGGKFEINRIGYGAMQLTGKGAFGEIQDQENAINLLQTAISSGVNFIDTAEAYGPHTNEILIKKALYPYKEDLVIATKGGLFRPGPFQWKYNGNPDFIRKNIESSLERLQIESIILWQLHRIDPEVPIKKTLEPVLDAVNTGKIKFVGLSEVSIDQLKAVEEILPIVSVQNLYNLSIRKWEDMVDYTASRNIAFIPWHPLHSGKLSLSEKIRDIAIAHDATVYQIALAWLLKRSYNIILIPGTKSLTHLIENLKSADIRLSDSEFTEISKAMY